MPLLEIDGLCLGQSSAMIRYLARKGDLYGECEIDSLWCDMTAGAVADFAEAGMQAAFQPSDEAAAAMLLDCLAKFGPRFEARLQANGGHMAGSRLSLADVVLAEALTNYTEQVPDLLDSNPAITDLLPRVTAHPGIAAYLASPNRWLMPREQYVVDLARVLQRRLPRRMPDPERFVRR